MLVFILCVICCHGDPMHPICNAEYKTDPYGEDNPMNAICSRGDLLPNPEFGGCYDTKVSVIIT